MNKEVREHKEYIREELLSLRDKNNIGIIDELCDYGEYINNGGFRDELRCLRGRNTIKFNIDNDSKVSAISIYNKQGNEIEISTNVEKYAKDRIEKRFNNSKL